MTLDPPEIREKILNGESVTPSDITDQWAGWCADGSYDHVGVETELVPVENIVGTAPQNTDRLDEKRLVKIVNKILNEDWEVKQDTIVLEQHPGGDYYVSSDGNHRVLAHKLLEIGQIYAEVHRYE